MHDLVTTHPGWQELQRQRAELERASATSRARWEAALAEHRLRTQEHNEARERALLAGDHLPPRPEPVDPSLNAMPLFLSKLQELRQRERLWLAEHADELGAQLERRETELLEQAAELTASLRALTPEVMLIARSIEKLRRENGDRRPVSTHNITPVDLVRAVETDRRFSSKLLAPAPMSSSRSAASEEEDDEPEMASFGAPPMLDEIERRRAAMAHTWPVS
jgi:hypothetical protein